MFKLLDQIRKRQVVSSNLCRFRVLKFLIIIITTSALFGFRFIIVILSQSQISSHLIVRVCVCNSLLLLALLKDKTTAKFMS